MSKNVEKCPSRLWEKMVGNDWENSLNAPNSSKSLPNCPKMSQSVPKCTLQTHRCPNGLVNEKPSVSQCALGLLVSFVSPIYLRGGLGVALMPVLDCLYFLEVAVQCYVCQGEPLRESLH